MSRRIISTFAEFAPEEGANSRSDLFLRQICTAKRISAEPGAAFSLGFCLSEKQADERLVLLPAHYEVGLQSRGPRPFAPRAGLISVTFCHSRSDTEGKMRNQQSSRVEKAFIFLVSRPANNFIHYESKTRLFRPDKVSNEIPE